MMPQPADWFTHIMCPNPTCTSVYSSAAKMGSIRGKDQTRLVLCQNELEKTREKCGTMIKTV